MHLPIPLRGEVRDLDPLIKRFRFRARQAAGKVRRFIQANIYTVPNEELLSRRRGECTRCGACCKILFRCPFLIEESPTLYSCGIYGQHFNQCRIFPLIPRDLEEIEEPCGYTFIEPEAGSQEPESRIGASSSIRNSGF